MTIADTVSAFFCGMALMLFLDHLFEGRPGRALWCLSLVLVNGLSAWVW